jgi:hypothetical protein
MSSDDPSPKHPNIIMTAADAIQERKAAEAEGKEPDVTPTDFGNPTAPPESPPETHDLTPHETAHDTHPD